LKVLLKGGSAAMAMLLALQGPGGAWAAPEQVAQVQPGGTIKEIAIEGSERIEPETIRSYLTVTNGDDFDSEKLDKSLKALFQTGLFADVNLQREGDTLIVRVVENPVINRVAYEGNDRFDDKALNDEVQLKPRSVYTRTKVQADVKRILDLYRHSGRFAATVEPKVIQLPQNRVDLVFEISEGKLTSINSINFIGNKVFGSDELLAITSTKESRWYRFFSSDDTYDPDRLTYDRELLRKFYLAQGYADFRVVSAVAELTPDRSGFIITFAIEEGERYHIGHIGMNVGLKNLKSDDLQPLLTTHEGDWYDADQVDKSVTALTTAVGDRGYAFVDVRPLITRNKDARTIDLTYDIAEGPRVYVERIDVAGNVGTLDRVLRREFTIAEGDAFNTSKVKRSEQNLKNLGFFKKVEVTNVPGSAPDKTVINVNVEEQSTGQLSLGTGFSTTEGLLLNASVAQSNLLGTGESISLSGTLSEFVKLIQFSFTDPRFLEKPLAAGYDLFDTQNDDQRLQDYDIETVGGDVRLGFEVYEDLRDTVRYKLAQTRLDNVTSTASIFIQEAEGAETESVIGNTLIWDRRDNRIDPTGGYYLQFDESVAGLGGTVKYFKTIASSGLYYQIAPKWVLANTTTVQDVNSYGGDPVFIGDRFFVGGDDLRGFATAGIGPRDRQTDDALGGNRSFTNQLNLSVPLGLPAELGVSGRLFTDVGTLFGVDQSGPTLIDSHAIRASSGLGVSWKSPVGPVKIDFGIPILKQPNDQTEIVRLNFGTRF
jgi:outer membrane protein insertion porin family